MDETADEAAVFIPQQHDKLKGATGLRGLFTFVASFPSSAARNASSARLLEDQDEAALEPIETGPHQPAQRKSDFPRRSRPSLHAVVLALITFALGIGIGIGIGCGVGLSVPSRDTFAQALADLASPNDHDADLPPYNAFGVPHALPTIAPTRLTNAAELDLKTAFLRGKVSPTVREYELNISHALAAPDGVWKAMILANGQSPGPLIEANVGDTVRVLVRNLMPNTTTSVHWHGINQYNSTWMDGVAGVSQCGIPPGGGVWVYEFVVAAQRGTFWWHAHAGVQFSDGLFGPIVIHDPDEMVPETDDDKIIFLGENYHSFAAELLSHYLAPTSPWDPTEAGVEPLADNLLLNGQHTFACAIAPLSTTFPPPSLPANTPACTGGTLYTTTVVSNSTTRLRLINHSSFFSYWFSIDGHTLSIVETDGVEVAPIAVAGVHVNIGQRYSVLLVANNTAAGTGGEFVIRSALERECFLPFATYNSSGLEAVGYEARGVLRYEDASSTATTTTTATSPDALQTQTMADVAKQTPYTPGNPRLCFDLPFSQPVPLRAEAAYPLAASDPQFILDFEFRQVGRVNRIFLNRTSWAAYEEDATLWEALEQDFGGGAVDGAAAGDGGGYHNWGFRLDQQVLLVPGGSASVQVVLNSLDVMEHPFHMHGHTVQIVGWGPGRYDPSAASTTTTTWNLENPMRRDTFTVPDKSHVVVRFWADNPGMWILHCHVAWHLEAGMAATFLERPEDMKALVRGMDEETRALGQNFCAKQRSRNGTGVL